MITRPIDPLRMRLASYIRWMRKLAIFSLLLASFGCGSDAGHGGRKVFRYNESKGITSLDPAQARSMGNIWAVNQVFDGLVRLDEKLKVQPSIAKLWSISEDGLTYTFNLRNDIQFHSSDCMESRVVVASDFVYSFQRILEPKVLSPGKWIFNQVDQENPKAFEAVDDTTLIIRLKQPFPPFLGILSMQYCGVVPQEAVECEGVDFGRNPVGTGPFRFFAWYEGVKLVLHKNENHYEVDDNGDQLPKLDAVGITFITDPQSVFLEFAKGNLDMLSGLEDGSFKDALITRTGQLKAEWNGKITMLSEPFLNTEYLGFMMDSSLDVMRSNPLINKNVRQAINYGFDREKMMKYIRNGIGTPGVHGFVPVGMWPSDSMITQGYSYQPEKARRLLADAGFPEGKGLPEITLYTTSQYVDICEYMQSQLKQIGMNLSIEVNPGATHGGLVSNGQVAFFRKSWIADYADPENYLSLFYGPNEAPKGPNYTRFHSTHFDSIYQASLTTTNDTLRWEYYQKMDSLVVEEAPVVVLFYDQVVRFVQADVSGLRSDPMNLLDLRFVEK